MALDSPPPAEAIQKGSVCAIVYPSQPSSRKPSRYNLNSPILIPPTVISSARNSSKNDTLSSVYVVTDVL